MNTVKIDKKNVRMIAHRGLSGIEKENTASAFVAAGNRSYFGIETDVHVTLDNRYIIIHDDNTKRVAIDSLDVENSTFDTLRNIQLCDVDNKRGRKDLCMPELSEYINICKKYEKVCVLELKNEMKAADISKIVRIISDYGYLENVIFISFFIRNLIRLRKILPEQHAQFLVEDVWKDKYYDYLSEYKLDLDIDHHLLTKDIVDRVHGIGVEVNCWTVNDPNDAARLIELGTDYITTNILE